MQAIRVHEFGEPEVLRLEEVADLSPGPGQVVVRVHAVGVNPVETYIRSGIYPKPPTPFTPGSDGAGVIHAVGDGVERVRVGDRVYIAGSLSGTYAEQALCREDQVQPLPEPASFSQGAAVFVPYATAYQALFHCGRARPGETLFVHGASGGVGIAAVQLGRAAGLTVLGTASTERGRSLATEHGAHHVFDHAAATYLDDVKTRTAPHGVDVILEMLANVNLNRDLDLLALHGRVIVIGNRGEKNQGTIAINPRAAMMRDAAIIGVTLRNATSDDLARIHAALVAGLANRTLQPVIGQEFPLGRAAEAHCAVSGAGKAYGKVVLLP